MFVIAFLSLLAVVYLARKKKKSGLDNALEGFFIGIFCDSVLLILAMAYLGSLLGVSIPL